MEENNQPPAAPSPATSWATISITCSCIGYFSLLLASRGDEMASIGFGVLIFLVMVGCLLVGFIGACIAASRGEPRQSVLTAFLLSAGPAVLGIIVSMLRHP